jgi:hypothetical protein
LGQGAHCVLSVALHAAVCICPVGHSRHVAHTLSVVPAQATRYWVDEQDRGVHGWHRALLFLK